MKGHGSVTARSKRRGILENGKTAEPGENDRRLSAVKNTKGRENSRKTELRGQKTHRVLGIQNLKAE